MFIKTTRNSKGVNYYHLVESFRQEGKVKHRVLMPLGRVDDGKVEQLARVLNKHLNNGLALDLAKDIDVKDAFILGPLLILDRMIQQLGLDQIWASIERKHKKLGFDLSKVLFTQLCSRFIRPVSKLALYDQWMERMYPVLVDQHIKLHQIYRSLDILAVHKEQIEIRLFHRDKDLFSPLTDVVLYDLTTLRFESTVQVPGKLRQFGFSKEMRTDCTQIVLGLITDTDGIPLCFEVHPGNTFEGKTLSGIVDKMRTRFSIRRFIFIADRGLFSSANLEHIRSSRGEFIVGMKMGSLPDATQKQLYDIKRFTWINEELAVRETTHGQDRLIITWSRSRAERDRRTRDDIVEKINQKLAGSSSKGSRTFVTNANYRKYLNLPGDGPCAINHQAIADQQARDGFFAIITNVTSLTAAQLVTHYKQLWKIEDAFGEIKGSLKTRPLFHWTDHRIIGHLVLCFLAYYMEAHLTRILRKSEVQLSSKSMKNKTIKPRPLTMAQVLGELNQVMAIPVTLKNKTCWVRTDIPPNALQLFKALGMPVPPKILGESTQM